MKSSPLQLKWVVYPSASYSIRGNCTPESVADPVASIISASVVFSPDGEHRCDVRIKDDGDTKKPFEFDITAYAIFSFDLAIARKEYKKGVDSNIGLPPIIAVNVSRILFAGAREYLAMLTARSPAGSAMLASVMLEPSDVRIQSEEPASQILREVFQYTDDELAPVIEIEKRKVAEAATPKSRKRHKAGVKKAKKVD